ncbi:hypothetical protein RT99_17945 [Flavobacterium sp. MEB061]|nr:hypothetical protein RT99_17945 [Flavobacterium sp. MEB061]
MFQKKIFKLTIVFCLSRKVGIVKKSRKVGIVATRFYCHFCPIKILKFLMINSCCDSNQMNTFFVLVISFVLVGSFESIIFNDTIF